MNNIINAQDLTDELQRQTSPSTLTALNQLCLSDSPDSRQSSWAQVSPWLCWLQPKVKKSLLKHLVSHENQDDTPARCLRVFLDVGCATDSEEVQFLYQLYAKRASSFKNSKELWNVVLDEMIAGLVRELQQSLPQALWKDVQRFPVDKEVQLRWKVRYSQLRATPMLMAKAHAFFVFKDMRNDDVPNSLALVADLHFPTDSTEYTSMYQAYVRNMTGYKIHDKMWEEVRTLNFPNLLKEINFPPGRWSEMASAGSWRPLLTELSNIDPAQKPKFYEALVVQDLATGEARRDPKRPHIFLALKNLSWPADSEEWESLYRCYHHQLDGSPMFRGLWLRILKCSQERLAWETSQLLPDKAWKDLVKYFQITSLNDPAKRQVRYPTWALDQLNQNPDAKAKFHDYLTQFDLEFDYPYSACFLLAGHEISVAYERNMTEYDMWRLVTSLVRNTSPTQVTFIDNFLAPESSLNINSAHEVVLPDPLYITSAVKREAYARFKPLAASASAATSALPLVSRTAKPGNGNGNGDGDGDNKKDDLSSTRLGVILHLLALISLRRQGTSVTALLAAQAKREQKKAPGAKCGSRKKTEKIANWLVSLKTREKPRTLQRRSHKE